MRALSAILEGVYRRQWPAQATLMEITRWWMRVCPERVYRNALPARIQPFRGPAGSPQGGPGLSAARLGSPREGGRLLVFCTTTSTWAQELSYRHDEFLERLGRELPAAQVRAIRFQVGRVPTGVTSSKKVRPRAVTPLRADQLPPHVARALAAIADDDLRDAVARAAAASLGQARRL